MRLPRPGSPAPVGVPAEADAPPGSDVVPEVAEPSPRARTVVPKRDRFGARDLVAEAAAGIGTRPARLLLTILGTVLGIGSLVVTIGMAQTAAGQIARQFDAIAATQVVVEPRTQGWGGDGPALGTLPWDAEERLLRLRGVEHAGALADVSIGDATISAVSVRDPSAVAMVQPIVLGASGGLLEAVRGEVVTGRFFDAGHDVRADRVVVLGSRAAERLGVHRVDRQPAIFIGERPYVVIGIIDGVARRGDLLDAVILPLGTARADFGVARPSQVHARIAVGAGPLVAEQAAVALDPRTPDGFEVQVPPTSSLVRDRVQGDVSAIFLALGAVALLVGGLGIANVTLLSVMERIGEIGLRRALGATRRQIGSQFLLESVVIGLLGGLIGAALGVGTVVVVSVVREWTPILSTPMVIGSALLGGVIGLVAGVYPALKAATIEPIAALRATR